MVDLVGQTIGSYRIEALLGTGGMARVFRGRHVHLDRLAAIKVMHDNLAADAGFQARFLQEARAIAALHHPHIVEIFDFGEHQGRYFLVLEFLEGGSLRNIVQEHAARGQAVPLPLGLELVRQAAAALAFAHERGVVHRDVKPDNMLLEPPAAGVPTSLKLSDFGLARLADASHLTASGMTMGTPAYMSPEQCQGTDLDGRSDLYSLGVVLYEIATGCVPFNVRSLPEAAYKHVHTPPPTPRALRPDLPEELERVVLRCLSKLPADRFVSGTELATALSSLLGDPALQSVNRTLVLPQPAAKAVSTPVAGTVAAAAPSLAGSPPTAGPLPGGSVLPRIQVLDEQGRPARVLEVTGDGLTIGRLPENDLPLANDAVSRHHLRVDWDGSDVRITDLGSSNGSFLGQTRLPPQTAQVWPPHGMLRLGPYWLRLEPPGSAPAFTAAASGAFDPAGGFGGTLAQPGSAAGSGRVGLALESDRLTLVPGQPAVFRATLANLGTTVDHLSLLVEGVPESWFQSPAPGAQLNPGAQREVALTVKAPRAPESTAGEYRVTVKARSREDPDEAGTAAAVWTVEPYSELELRLKPSRVSAGTSGRFGVELRNRGNSPVRGKLAAEDDEQALRYDFDPATPELTPGAAAEPALTVNAPRRWTGPPQVRPFTVRFEPDPAASDPAPRTTAGQFVHTALLPSWAPAALVALLAALGLAVAGPLGLLKGILPAHNARQQDPAVRKTAAAIRTFQAMPASVHAGEKTTLTWDVSGAAKLEVKDLGEQPADATSVEVTPQTTTEYVLRATGEDGAVVESKPVTVTVVPAVVAIPKDAVLIRDALLARATDLLNRAQGAHAVQRDLVAFVDPPGKTGNSLPPTARTLVAPNSTPLPMNPEYRKLLLERPTSSLRYYRPRRRPGSTPSPGSGSEPGDRPANPLPGGASYRDDRYNTLALDLVDLWKRIAGAGLGADPYSGKIEMSREGATIGQGDPIPAEDAYAAQGIPALMARVNALTHAPAGDSEDLLGQLKSRYGMPQQYPLEPFTTGCLFHYFSETVTDQNHVLLQPVADGLKSTDDFLTQLEKDLSGLPDVVKLK